MQSIDWQFSKPTSSGVLGLPEKLIDGITIDNELTQQFEKIKKNMIWPYVFDGSERQFEELEQQFVEKREWEGGDEEEENCGEKAGQQKRDMLVISGEIGGIQLFGKDRNWSRKGSEQREENDKQNLWEGNREKKIKTSLLESSLKLAFKQDSTTMLASKQYYDNLESEQILQHQNRCTPQLPTTSTVLFSTDNHLRNSHKMGKNISTSPQKLGQSEKKNSVGKSQQYNKIDSKKQIEDTKNRGNEKPDEHTSHNATAIDNNKISIKHKLNQSQSMLNQSSVSSLNCCDIVSYYNIINYHDSYMNTKMTSSCRLPAPTQPSKNSSLDNIKFPEESREIPKLWATNSRCEIREELELENGNKNQEYTYEVNQGSLVINSEHEIELQNINKISLMDGGEQDKANIKISYIYENKKNNIKNRENKQLHRNASDSGHAKRNMLTGRELVLFMGECYEKLYVIFASIIVKKIVLKWKEGKNNVMCEKVKLLTTNSELFNINMNMTNEGNKRVPNVNWNCKVEGYAMKRSKHLKNWQKKYMKISNYELRSYRIASVPLKNTSLRDEKSGCLPPFVTPQKKQLKDSSQQYREIQTSESVSKECTFVLDNIIQLWTRFQLLDNQYLVMKMYRKNKWEKIQLAVPIANFSDPNAENNWVQGLVGMLRAKQL